MPISNGALPPLPAMTGLDPRQLWQNVLAELQIQMRPEDFRTWFQNTELLAYDGTTCIVGVENPFNVQWLRTKCQPLVSRTLEALLGRPVAVEFVVAKPEPPTGPAPPLALAAPPYERPKRPRGRRGPSAASQPLAAPRYTFDNFVVGNENRLAYAAARAVAEGRGQVPNPLFLYGGVGLGKTHLLHAIAHAAIHRGLRVLSVSADAFTNDFTHAIRRDRMDEFRASYRSNDVLLIDDIHFLPGTEKTQQELFHTFNAIHEAGGHIVLASDRPPKAVSTIEARLRSRFLWGLVADIQPPDLETRVSILRAKAAQMAPDTALIEVADEVLAFIATRFSDNIRELEGALHRVRAYAEMLDAPVTREVAAAALRGVLEPDGHRSATPSAVIEAVCCSTGVSRAELEGKHRDRHVVVPRQIAMYLLREGTDLSLSQVGALLGGRDHTTVHHSCEKIAAEIQRDAQRRSTVGAIHDLIARGL